MTWVQIGTTMEGWRVYIERPEPTELVCEDCMAGDHRTCREGGGYLDDDSNERRCGCHLTAHALDNRS